MNSKEIIRLILKTFGKSLPKTFLGLVILIVLVVSFYFTTYSKNINQNQGIPENNNSSVNNIEEPKNTVSESGGVVENIQPDQKQENINNIIKEGPYKIAKVVDGDTLDLMINNIKTRIRMIGVNTPEAVDPRKTVECFGIEASNYSKSILTNQSVYIEKDPTQGEKDKYGRNLAYIFLEDGTNFNLKIIQEGYGYEYTYNIPYKYQKEFKEAQNLAQAEKRGLWAEGVCN